MYTSARNAPPQRSIVLVAVAGSAVTVLLLGTLVYFLDRDWSSVPFLAPFADPQPPRGTLFGRLGYWLPSLCHAYAFAALMILALGQSRSARWCGACAWFVVAAALEFAQSAPISDMVAQARMPLAAFVWLPGFEGFVTQGSFDSGDLLASALGCLVAWVVTSRTEVPK